MYQGYRLHIMSCPFRRLANRVGHCTCFANPHANLSTVVAHHRHHTETKPATTFDDFGDPGDVYNPLIQFLSLCENLAIPKTSGHSASVAT
jgi:hypothetical protein